VTALIDMTGMRIGSRVVLERVANNIHGGAMWRCICDCGAISDVWGVNLRNGNSPSCGCKTRNGTCNQSHGDSKGRPQGIRIPLYNCWNNMKSRCSNPKVHNYSNYGGRGIRVCDEWRGNYPAFKEWALANGYADGLTIDRIDNDGNYEPRNCQWVTASANASKARASK